MEGEEPALPAGEQEDDNVVIVSEKSAVVHLDGQQAKKKQKVSYQASLLNMFNSQPPTG